METHVDDKEGDDERARARGADIDAVQATGARLGARTGSAAPLVQKFPPGPADAILPTFWQPQRVLDRWHRSAQAG